MIKPTLIILSDINGIEEGDWSTNYERELETGFNIVTFDVRELAEIDSEGKSEEEVHALFVDGGIELAANNLLDKHNKPCIVLGFSIGGTIAWKAAQNGLPVAKIAAVSATRLRMEYQRPRCELDLYFGQKDYNRPMDEWFEAMEIYPTILLGREHEMYKEEFVIEKVTRDLFDFVQY